MINAELYEQLIVFFTNQATKDHQKNFFTSRELLNFIDADQEEINTTLEELRKKILFIKKRSNDQAEIEYGLTLFKPTIEFLTKIINLTQQILTENQYSTNTELEEILNLHGFTVAQLTNLYPTKTKGNTIREIISSLKALHILKSNDNLGYYLDLGYFQANLNLDKELALQQFWNPILNVESIKNLELHGMFFKSPTEMLIDITKFDDTWKEKKANGKGKIWIKTISIPLGTIKLEVFSNQNNPLKHTLHIYYEGKLLLVNTYKRKEVGKFAVNINQFAELNTYIKAELYRCYLANIFQFGVANFELFNMESIGLNIDTDTQLLKFPDLHFMKDITMRDFKNFYILRFYQYTDNFDKKEYLRTDLHADKPQTVLGMIDALTQMSQNIINPHITQRKKNDLLSQNIASVNQIHDQLDHLVKNRQVETEKYEEALEKSNSIQNNNYIALSESNQKQFGELKTTVLEIKNELSLQNAQSLDNLQTQFDQFVQDTHTQSETYQQELETVNSVQLQNYSVLSETTQKHFEALQTSVVEIKNDFSRELKDLQDDESAQIQLMIDSFECKIETSSQSIINQNTEYQTGINSVIGELKDNLIAITDFASENQQQTHEIAKITTKLEQSIQKIESFLSVQQDMNKTFIEQNNLKDVEIARLSTTFNTYLTTQAQTNTQNAQILTNLTQIITDQHERSKPFLQRFKEHRKKK